MLGAEFFWFRYRNGGFGVRFSSGMRELLKIGGCGKSLNFSGYMPSHSIKRPSVFSHGTQQPTCRRRPGVLNQEGSSEHVQVL